MGAASIVLAGFFGAWIGVAIAGKKRGWSVVEYLGGGFLAATVVLCIFGGVAMLFQRDQLPSSIAAAGLAGKAWAQDDAKLAAKITVNNLRDMDFVLGDADKRGDAAAAVKLLDLATELLRAWGDQKSNPSAAPYRNCLLAVAHLTDGVIAVSQGGRYLTRDRYKAALDACPR
jgi:hypothetical protein